MKIIVGYDPPHPDSKLIDRAKNTALQNNGHIYLVTSLSDRGQGDEEEMERREEALHREKARLDGESVSCEAHLLVGHNSPGEDIVAFAEENEAFLLSSQLILTKDYPP